MSVPAAATAAHQAAERRDAARALLAHPILAAETHLEELTLVRRHAVALRTAFASSLGYPLVVEGSFARLIKTPLPQPYPPRPALRAGTGGTLTPRAYTYLALACAALLHTSAGEQVLLSGLVSQIRADAVTSGVTIDDSLPERRALVHALALLVTWGVLAETDGTAAAWERHEEALLTVNRSLLPHLLARPLSTLARPDDLWSADPDADEQPRRSLRRKLVESPLVRREDLTDAERDVLSRERSELSRVLDEQFGLTLEVRAEGALAFDPDNELTDVAFPGIGTLRQAALLVVDALVDTDDAASGVSATVDGRDVPGLPCAWSDVDHALSDLVERHTKVWGAEYTADPARLRTEVVALLESLSLAQATDEHLILHAAAYRYRAEPFRAPAKPRALRRLEGDPEADATRPISQAVTAQIPLELP